MHAIYDFYHLACISVFSAVGRERLLSGLATSLLYHTHFKTKKKSIFYIDICTMDLVQFIIQTNKCTAYTGCLQMNGAVSEVNKKFISHLTRTHRTPSAAATIQVSHALPAVRFSCLLRGCGVSLQDGAAAGKGFLCAPF